MTVAVYKTLSPDPAMGELDESTVGKLPNSPVHGLGHRPEIDVEMRRSASPLVGRGDRAGWPRPTYPALHDAHPGDQRLRAAAGDGRGPVVEGGRAGNGVPEAGALAVTGAV